MIALHITLRLHADQGPALENVYRTAYVPAISKQDGFRATTLLRAGDDADRYEIDIEFDSEAQRQAWADGADHAATWPRIVALCTEFTAQGFEILD
jgi:heme-degrading monooxygenase HmoA